MQSLPLMWINMSLHLLLFPHFCHIVFGKRRNKPGLREWSLIMGRGGGGYKTDAKGGGGSEILPLQIKGGRKCVSYAEGRGGTESFEIVSIQELEV